MTLLERLERIAAISVISDEDKDSLSSTHPRQDRIIFCQSRVDLLVSNAIQDIISYDIKQSWVNYPPPPSDFDAADIATILLCSHSYTVNRVSFPWQGATEIHFQRLWRLLGRICVMSVQSDILSSLLGGRSTSGYSSSRGIRVMPILSETSLLRNVHSEFIEDMKASIKVDKCEAPHALASSRFVDNYVSVICLSARAMTKDLS